MALEWRHLDPNGPRGSKTLLRCQVSPQDIGTGRPKTKGRVTEARVHTRCLTLQINLNADVGLSVARYQLNIFCQNAATVSPSEVRSKVTFPPPAARPEPTMSATPRVDKARARQ